MANWIPLWLHKLSSPPMFYRFAGALRPWAIALALVLGLVALYGGLVLAPSDYQQGDDYRIIFSHLPCAWMSLFIYGVMGAAAWCWHRRTTSRVTPTASSSSTCPAPG